MEVIKDSLIQLSLPISNLRGQTYDGASNMLGHKSGVAKQIIAEQPKAFDTHCHGHALSLSVKEATKSSTLLNDVMGTVAEINILVKYSPKREQILGSIKEMFKFADDDEYDQTVTISKLCVTCWTVRATIFIKVLSNYAQLMKLWEICLQETLTREFKLYLITDNLSKSLPKESMSAIEGQRIAQLTLKTLQNMCTDEASDLFYERVLVTASKHEFILNPALSRKRKHPNYKLLDSHF